MAVTYDAPLTGNPGGPDFETALAIYWSGFDYPQRPLGNFTMTNESYTMVQQLDYWYGLALDSVDPLFSGFFLYEETARELQSPGGLVQWTRRYGNVPATYNTYSFEAVTFPGYYSEWDADAPTPPATSVYRPPLTKMVRVREAHSFLLSLNPWTTWTIVNGMTMQTGELAYVDYVDNSTTTNAGGYSPSTPAMTYADWLDKISGAGGAIQEFSVKNPTLKRAYGAGNIWERVEYYAYAE